MAKSGLVRSGFQRIDCRFSNTGKLWLIERNEFYARILKAFGTFKSF
jgi:hypothetical protein